MPVSDNPVTIVIFGAAGDLTRRKLVPALFNQFCRGNLPEQWRIVGFSIEDYPLEDFKVGLEDGVRTFSPQTYTAEKWAAFAENVIYIQGNLTEFGDFQRLASELNALEGGAADRLYYLAITPTLIEATMTNLGAAGMAQETDGQRRVIIEKPFGRDLASARQLNGVVHSTFAEHQVYRIDHYLGKETAQNVLFFRFANIVFESLWNRSYIDSVQITVAENVDVGHRAGYYDQSGVMRDMIQNHLLQLLTLIAMEPPGSFQADDLRNEKVKVLRSVRPIDLADTVRGQYEGYRTADGVAPDSTTPTYAALKLHIDNWRWEGVPFYLRSGKALRRKATEIAIQFKQPPRILFNMAIGRNCAANVLSLCIQPDEGIHLRFDTKVPGSIQSTRTTDLEFHYEHTFGQNAIPEAYERLLLDAISGDASLFIRNDEIEAAWDIIDPVLTGWETADAPPLETYAVGSWGAEAGDDLLARDGFKWQLSCAHD